MCSVCLAGSRNAWPSPLVCAACSFQLHSATEAQSVAAMFQSRQQCSSDPTLILVSLTTQHTVGNAAQSKHNQTKMEGHCSSVCTGSFCSQSKQSDSLEFAVSALQKLLLLHITMALQWLSLLSQDRRLLTLHCNHCASMQLAHIPDDIIAV